MSYNICIFEDEYFSRLYPLSLTRPVYELRCGISLLREKLCRNYAEHPLYLFCRDYLAPVLKEALPEVAINEKPGSPCLFLNGRFVFDTQIPEIHLTDKAWINHGQVAAAWINSTRLAAVQEHKTDIIPSEFFAGLPQQEIGGSFINYPWDLVHHNPEQIKQDFKFFNLGGQILGAVLPHATLIKEENIYIAHGAVIKPGAVLDAGDGPIFIDQDAVVMANACVQGPLFLGSRSAIKMGAKIYEGTSIGEVCKVGGEVEESIIHSHSNKQHEGFLGHSYLGQWVNIGADSNTSDLKNNYSTVRVHINGEMVDSGLMFVGLTMGDHSKCGINTMFNTGSVVGVMSNVFGSGYSDKYIPSFTWGGIESSEEYALEKALEVARRVMERRKIALTSDMRDMLRRVFEMTTSER
jgi:UDP-N-acetylglucosamine diphosphorylase / glucose-1-phosphate thymidylyltransferase / UDP-N-acetylgalactosamine diphosphorylase / glucosamine-1-phosphate N-acetyltransferase / galactosamine-1-phosphate N-acetyltransferase